MVINFVLTCLVVISFSDNIYVVDEMSYRHWPFSASKKRKKKSKSGGSKGFSSDRKSLLAELDEGSYYDQDNLLEQYDDKTLDTAPPCTSSSTRKLAHVEDGIDFEGDRWIINIAELEKYLKKMISRKIGNLILWLGWEE